MLVALPERFTSKFDVDAATGCWIWNAATAKGYGRFSLPTGRRPVRLVLAHRYAFEMLRGPIPEGMQLDHLCRRRACVNPDHLEPVTGAENLRRGIHKNQNTDKVRCKNGHDLSIARVYDGRRICRVCDNERQRARYAYGWRQKRAVW